MANEDPASLPRSVTATASVDPAAETVGSTPPPGTAPDPLVGRTMAHFRVDALVGRGGMGAVYRAWDSSLQRAVALKVLLEDTEQTRQRFMREARAQARIKHPNVVPIHFVGEHDGIAFLVMDFVEGETLSAILRRDGPLVPERALDVAEAVARALEAGAEHGLVHRDVKPGNVLVDSHGRVLLADFGLAKWTGGDAPAAQPTSEPEPRQERAAPPTSTPPDSSNSGVVTKVGAVVGTPAYAAPEQTQGQPVDTRADVYALGVTLYEMLTGQPPFSAPTLTGLISQHRDDAPLSPRVLAPTLPARVEGLVLKMMAKRPEDRFQSPSALLAAITAARERSRTDANAFVRFLALIIDLACFGIGAGLASLLWQPLAAPVLVALMGTIEGGLGLTPGKGLLQLRIIDARGEPPGIGRGLVRAVTKLWGPLLASLLSWILPDGDVASVILALCVVVWLGWSATILFGKHRAMHDRLAHTRVVYAI